MATSLNNLAELYRVQGNYSEAEPLYQRSLAIREKVLGSEHPSVATSLNNLAALYRVQGNYSEAEPLYQRSLAIREKVLGSEHPDVATSLNNLAELYRVQGNYSEAEPLYQRSLAIREKVLGSEHPDVATSLNNLAGLYWGQNNIPLALEYLTRGTNIQENNLAVNITTGSEAQKRAYVSTLAGSTDWTISLHLQDAPNNIEAARLALTTILRRKGRILDAVVDNIQTLRQNLTREDQQLLDELAATRSQLSTLIYRGVGESSPAQYQQQVNSLQAQANQLEVTLSRRSAQFRVESQPVTIETVQQLIPQDTALVELVLYKPVNPLGRSVWPKTNQFGQPRYAAYILHSTGEPKWIDLGEAEVIDKAVTAFRNQLTDYRIIRKEAARSLDKLLMQPIRELLGDTKNILLSPDSQLNLIPFAALVDENNKYLVENYSITYLTTGRDLLKLQIAAKPKQPPVIVANPNYDTAIVETASRGSRDVAQLNWCCTPLPGTDKEAAAIKPMLRDATVFTETQATEEAVKQVKAPSILHIATHGFFLTTEAEETPQLGGSLQITPVTPAIATENPLLRSGLAMAGFNPQQGKLEGVLTALEVASLNLWGNKLVVLSACQTGVGDVRNGEGVYGLRRALVIAGSESQVISLWDVADEGTKELMVNYYQKLIDNIGRSDALRQTQLEMLNSEEYAHPFFWAAFIPSGNWHSLKQLPVTSYQLPVNSFFSEQ